MRSRGISERPEREIPRPGRNEIPRLAALARNDTEIPRLAALARNDTEIPRLATPARNDSLTSQRVRTDLEVHHLARRSLPALHMEWRAGADRRPQSSTFPA